MDRLWRQALKLFHLDKEPTMQDQGDVHVHIGRDMTGSNIAGGNIAGRDIITNSTAPLDLAQQFAEIYKQIIHERISATSHCRICVRCLHNILQYFFLLPALRPPDLRDWRHVRPDHRL